MAALQAAQQEPQQRQQQQQEREVGLLAVKGSRSNSPLHSVNGLTGGWSQLTQQHLQELQQQLDSSSAAEKAAAACPFCNDSTDSAQQLCRLAGAAAGCGRQGCPAAQHAFYGEMHDSSGSVPYVGMTQGARQELRAAAGAPASRGRAPPRRAASFAGGAPAASAMAAPAEGGARRRAGPSRSVSFRVEPAQQQGDAAGAAGAGGSSSQPARRWTEPTEQLADDASVCSAATMATWVSGSTQCTGTSCSTDDSSSIAEAEQLFNMTGGRRVCLCSVGLMPAG